MRIFDVYVTIKQEDNSNRSNTSQLSQEVMVVANNIKEAAEKAIYQMRGYVSLHPLIYGNNISTTSFVDKVTDMNFECNLPIKQKFNYGI